ncbi:MAG: diheme cytochrome c [Burkholderiales bacterium]|nr:diheme cytochrome c [Burkholderiales bacterium]
MKNWLLAPVKYARAAIKNIAIYGVTITAFLLPAVSVHADSGGARVPLLPKYSQECSACHVAYPAGFLPAASWQRVMEGLGKHYGTDASLDEASMREISGWLKANAGTYKRVSEEPPENRITKAAWFLRKHREGEVPANVWKRASVGSPANCAACHTNADKGNFNEHEVRIPK